VPKKKQFSVLPTASDWVITQAGQMLEAFDNKDNAVERARQLARHEGPSQLRIHGRNGRLQEEHTYDREDPRASSYRRDVSNGVTRG
jgi:hypothetical protein